MGKMPHELKDRLLLWVDDIVLACKIFDNLLTHVRILFEICMVLNFKFHTDKCRLYKQYFNWCGHYLSKNGVQFDPHNINAREQMLVSAITAELMQVTSPIKRKSTSILVSQHFQAPIEHSLSS